MGLLEDSGTLEFGGPRQAFGVLERMQMPASRVDEAAEIMVAAHMKLQFVTAQQRRRAIAVVVVQLMQPFGQFIDVARLGRNMHVIRVVVALDAILRDQRLGAVQRLDGELE